MDQEIHIFICEDDKIQMNRLSDLLKEYAKQTGKDICLTGASQAGEEILRRYDEDAGKHLSLCFVDVQLQEGKMDGFRLARKLKEKDPLCQLVFLTSRDELAYKTYEYDLNVLDYIIKCPEYFLQNGIHARLKERLDRIFAKLERMPMAESDDRKEIIVDSGSRQIHLDTENILYVQAVKQTHQLEIVAKEQKITTRATLKEMYGRLGDGFIYINRSCIAARNKIMEIDKKNRILILEGGYHLEISYREMKNLLGSDPLSEFHRNP